MQAAGNPSRGVAQVAGAALLWSSSGIFIKVLTLNALQIAGWRSLLAALTLLAFAKALGWKAPLRPDPLTLACATAYAAMLVTFVAATKLTAAANAIFLQFSAPIYLVFLEPLVFKRAISGKDLAAVAICLGGMALFFVGRLEAGTLSGNLLGVGSGVCFALFTLALKLKRERHPQENPIGAIILGNLLVALVCLPLALPGFRPTPVQAGLLLFLGVFQIGIAYILFNAGMRHLSATAAVVVGTLEAVLNPVWVFLGLGERPSPWALAGGLVVLGVVVWYGLSHRQAVVEGS